MKVSAYNLSSPLVSLAVFLISLAVGPYYLGGDQLHYRRVYDELAHLGLVDGYIFYANSLDSKEFVHFFLSFVASRHIDKDIFMSVSNAILAYASMQLCRKWEASVLVAALIPLTNFYFYVMYFSAERLKFGFIFLVLALTYTHRPVRFYSLSFLAIVSHAQTTLVYLSVAFRIAAEKFLRLAQVGKFNPRFIVLVFLGALPVLLMREQFISKIGSYYELRSLEELYRVIVFFGLSLWYARNKIQPALIFVPIILATIFVGGDRVNMLGYFMFMYFGLSYRRGLNAGVLGLIIYFAFKSNLFVLDVIANGTGFDVE